MSKTDFSESDIAVLLDAHDRQAEQDYSCDECGECCAPYEQKINYQQWSDNGLCYRCNEKGFREQQSELRGLRSIGY